METSDITHEDSYVDLLRVEGINAKGFGTIPKTVMKDPRLTLQAKGIYAYFCSYAGSGNRVFPSRNTILRDLGINVTTYYKHFNLLKICDYIRVQQQKREGAFAFNIYTLVVCPDPVDDENTPCTKKSYTVKSNAEKPYTKKEYSNRIINEKEYNTTEINPSINPKLNDMIEKLNEYVKANIEYEMLCDGKNDKLAQSILTLIVEVLSSTIKSYRINGTDMPAKTVRSRFKALNYSDVTCVLNSVGKGIGHIRNPRNYLLTALFNSKTTSEMFWQNEVKYAQKLQHKKEAEQKRAEKISNALDDMVKLAGKNLED